MSHSLEKNKIAAAVLIALIVLSVSGLVAQGLMSTHHPEEDAYPIEVADAPAGEGETTTGPTGPEPVSGLLANASVDDGAKIFKKCAACHTPDKGGPNRIGPNLWGIIGAPRAHLGDFAYSDDMKAMGGTWDYEALNAFIYKPKTVVPGTKMNFVGLKKPEDRASLILYLRSLHDNPPPIPAAAP